MRRLALALLLLAAAGHAGIRTYPPSGGGIGGGGGPLPQTAILPPGSIAYFTMGEAAGDRLDSVASNDLTPTGTVNQVAGKVGFGAGFPGSLSPAPKLEKAVTTGVWPSGSYTIAAWIDGTSLGTNTEIFLILRDVVGARDLWRLRRSFQVTPTNKIGQFFHRDSVGEKAVGSGGSYFLQANTWTLYVVSYDAALDTLTLEVGATSFPQSSSTTTGVDSVDTAAGAVALTVQGGDFGNGFSMDELGIWHRVLSAAEKQDIFAGVTY